MCWCVHRHENLQSMRPSTSSESGTSPLSSQAGMSTNPVPPPRTRKSSSHNSLLLAPATTLLPGSVPDIQAATAIAGHISANQELPYMTPPLPSQETDPPQQQQLNFSGDSQDSSELLAGYFNYILYSVKICSRDHRNGLRNPHQATSTGLHHNKLFISYLSILYSYILDCY